MRLIDADAIKNLEWITERGMADCGEEFVYMSAINKMPTVDPQSCDGCKYDDIVGNPKCEFCSRILPDRYKPKEKEE